MNKKIFILILLIIIFFYKKKENFEEQKKKIVIIEFNNHPYLRKLINNILENKPSDWDLQVITSKNLDINNLPQENVIFTKLDIENTDKIQYNKLLKSKKFWNLIDAEYIQIVKVDSAFCNKNKNLNDFLKFHFIGCSYDKNSWNKKNMGLGSFSLRRKSFVLKCLDKYPELLDNEYPSEDSFFGMCLINNKDKNNYIEPSQNDINNYCVEYSFNEKQDAPLGMNVSYIPKKNKNWLKKKCNIGKYLL